MQRLRSSRVVVCGYNWRLGSDCVASLTGNNVRRLRNNLSPSELTNQATRSEWRELGFFYERETNPNSWRIVGSLDGLANFPRLLDLYARDPRNQAQSEHSHYGPYMYLKVETAESPQIDERSIRGSLSDLLRLRDLVAERLRQAKRGDSFFVGTEYSQSVTHPLHFDVREDGFDPASADSKIAGSAT